MHIPDQLKYSATHQWARLESDGTILVGLTDFAQQELGDVVFVEEPKLWDKLAMGEQICIVESITTATEVYAPISGEVIAINARLEEHPELINDDPYDMAWICRIEPKDITQLQHLMNAEAYRLHIV